jgi:hypothetical protein
MAKLTPADFADWVFKHLEQNVWLTEATMQRRLAGVKQCPFTAARLLAALVAAGWASPHPKYPGEYVLASSCWLSEKPKAAKDTTPSGSQKIAHS